MRFNYVINPSLLQSPRMQKYELEDRLLSQLLLDMALVGQLKDEMGAFKQQNI